MPDKLHIRIKSRRTELGMSQDALATSCEVGQSTVANWERGGHIPRQPKLKCIAKALQVDEVWLISGEHATDKGAINRYLNTPIRHIPVYNWPKSKTSFETEKPIGYVTMTIGPENVFALFAPKNGTDFKAETMLMFSRDYDKNEPGTYLELSETHSNLVTSKQPTELAAARLIFSQSTH